MRIPEFRLRGILFTDGHRVANFSCRRLLFSQFTFLSKPHFHTDLCTGCRWLSPLGSHCHDTRVSGLSPVSIMSTRLTAMGSIGRVQSPPEAIEFAAKVKAWCNTNGILWWYSCVVSEHHSEEAKAKNIRDKARAQRLGYLKQIEIDGYLGLPVPRTDMPTPSRLDMMEAASNDEVSPEPSSATSPPPTTSRTPDAVRNMHDDNSIQRAVLSMVMTATDSGRVLLLEYVLLL